MAEEVDHREHARIHLVLTRHLPAVLDPVHLLVLPQAHQLLQLLRTRHRLPLLLLLLPGVPVLALLGLVGGVVGGEVDRLYARLACLQLGNQGLEQLTEVLLLV